MALIKMVIRKMCKNKGLVMFLLLGLLISSALMSSIPLYSQGVLQKVLVKDMENFQNASDIYPGTFSVGIKAEDSSYTNEVKGVKDEDTRFLNDSVKKFYKKLVDNALTMDDYLKNSFPKEMYLDTVESSSVFSTVPKKMVHDNFKQGDYDDSTYSKVKTLKDYEKHVKLIDGKFPAKGKKDGVYEVLISSGSQHKQKLVLNRVYLMSDVEDRGAEPIKVKPVGVFEEKAGDGVFWSAIEETSLDECVIMNEEDMINGLVKPNPTQLDSVKWFLSVDYHKLTMDNLSKVYSSYNKISKDLYAIRKSTEISFTLNSIINDYTSKMGQLKTTMWSLNVPVLVMLSIYMFMISNLIINKEKNEIALLISRGASRMQVVFGYLIEGIILGTVAFVLGPILGMYLSKILGTSSGFLQFVNRKALSVHLSLESYGYSLIANIIFLVTLLIPAYRSSNTSIVGHKRKMAREKMTALWQKLYLDVILLLISGYGYYEFNQRKQAIKVTAAAGSDLKVDPILFFIPVLFILGMSLLCLRLYPLFLKLVYRIGKKFWTPSMYGTLVQVSRSSISYHFLMVFIMLTLSIGTYSATAARTINSNGEDRIGYVDGADITMRHIWEQIIDNSTPSAEGDTSASESSTSKDTNKALPLYIEPPFQVYEKLPGVQKAAKVFTQSDATVSVNDTNLEAVKVMAVEPYDFGNVVWYRQGLLPHHINEYLNLLSAESSACIISEEVSKETGLKIGDSFTLSFGVNRPVVFNVYAVVGYWPTFTPSISSKPGPREPKFVITNLSYVQDNFPKEPYNVWIKLKDGASRQAFYDAIKKDSSIVISSLVDTKKDLIELKNDSSQLAINGSLTLGFIISGLICFMGFVLYWVLSLKERSLQFGILRAIGLSSAQLRFMMVWEQILTSGVAMAIGTLVGLLCSRFYVEFFRLSASYADQTPPFRVVSYLSDRIKVYGFIGMTMLFGLGILIYLLSKIKISNVIKLGED